MFDVRRSTIDTSFRFSLQVLDNELQAAYRRRHNSSTKQ